MSVAAAALMAAGSAQAALLNGGFETGDFTDWTTSGTTSVVGIDTSGSPTASTVSPVEGNYQAKLVTEGTSAGNLAAFLGVDLASLEGLASGTTTDGSAIKQTVNAKAGQTLKFSYYFNGNDYLGFDDYGFFTVGNGANLLSSIALVGDYNDSGYKDVEYTFLADGLYTLGFGVANTNDTQLDSILYIDGVAVVPEPAAVAGLLAIGALGAGAIKRKRRANLA
ncbi:hypothetical protein BST81_26475 [Leptolyngbya sp. 'hensonii']|nr:hypothetical protein BST81_26475 [Leptolyngbya sp. 'hensonii']